jgi:hypothetical protein
MLRDTPGEVLVCCDLSYYRASRGLRLTGELCPPARQRRSPEGGPLSSAILYGAIVVIWAGVLIPRWLRRGTSSESCEDVTMPAEVSAEPATSSSDSVAAAPSAASHSLSPPVSHSAAPPVPGPGSARREPRPGRAQDPEHTRVIGARRRLLGMLIALATGAGVLAAMKLAAWWVILPPSVMLIGYLGLLREASRADAERRWTAVSTEQARATTTRAPAAPTAPTAATRVAGPGMATAPVVPPVVVPPPDAEIIDITGRVSDELYDQISDAKLRAVGD